MTIIQPKPSLDEAREPEPLIAENPVTDAGRSARAGANLYGAFSVENFCSAGPLTLTHDDAAGFLAYTSQFNPHNFWYQDACVKIWAYYQDFDNWQDTYGMDAVRVAYHSGHGGMDANGVFYAPMGSVARKRLHRELDEHETRR